jgi:hypothetical protein
MLEGNDSEEQYEWGDFRFELENNEIKVIFGD